MKKQPEFKEILKKWTGLERCMSEGQLRSSFRTKTSEAEMVWTYAEEGW